MSLPATRVRTRTAVSFDILPLVGNIVSSPSSMLLHGKACVSGSSRQNRSMAALVRANAIGLDSWAAVRPDPNRPGEGGLESSY